MIKFIIYLGYSVLALFGVFILLAVLFAFVFKNPLGVTDQNIIKKANEFGIRESFVVRDYINTHNACPQDLEGWVSETERQGFQKKITIPKDGKGADSIPLWYTCDPKLRFSIWIRYSIDSDLSVTGGKEEAIKIQYGHFSEPNVLFLKNGTSYEEAEQSLIESKLVAKYTESK